MSLRVATANILVTLGRADARGCLAKVIAEDPDIIAVQEWGKNRQSILDSFKDYANTRGPRGGGPVLWKKDRFRLLRVSSKMLAPEQNVGVLPGRKTTLPPSWMTEAHLLDLKTGEHLVVLNFHLTANVDIGPGRYRVAAIYSRRVRRHMRERRILTKRVAKHKQADRKPYPMGDTNYHRMVIRGVYAWWKGWKEAPGTFGNRTIDGIYGPGKPKGHAKAITTKSDHRAVVAKF